jgi:hypothetical protein
VNVSGAITAGAVTSRILSETAQHPAADREALVPVRGRGAVAAAGG